MWEYGIVVREEALLWLKLARRDLIGRTERILG